MRILEVVLCIGLVSALPASTPKAATYDRDGSYALPGLHGESAAENGAA